jgi:hypothetical protein
MIVSNLSPIEKKGAYLGETILREGDIGTRELEEGLLALLLVGVNKVSVVHHLLHGGDEGDDLVYLLPEEVGICDLEEDILLDFLGKTEAEQQMR